MKKFFPTLFVACALVIPTALNAASFEGKVRMQISSGAAKKGDAQDIDYRIKDGLVRVDMQLKDKSGKPAAGAPSIIIDSKKEEMILLMPEGQTYMVSSLVDKNAGAGKSGTPRNAAGKTPEYKLEKTGETETILGFKCEKYLLKEDKTTMAMWLTSELGDFAGFGSTAGGPFGGRAAAHSPQAQEWAKVLAGKSLFPMRVVGSNTSDSKENFRMEVTAIEKQSLPASDFAPPAGWKKFEMPSMGDMMKGMIPGMGR